MRPRKAVEREIGMRELRVEALTKSIAGTKILDGVSFTAAPGEFVALLGPSGCGKSTLLKLIAGLDFPDGGRILADGVDITKAQPQQRGLSLVFQSYALFPHMTVAENVLFGLRVRGVPAGEREKRLTEAAEMLSLGPLLQRRPAQLSGGQQQRVALCRAIVSRSPICLMDEPLSNLDVQLRHSVRREILGLQKRLGFTLIYVTHDQIEAMSMADQIVLMSQGKVMQKGSPVQLHEMPQNLFAAEFIGSPPMNFMTLTPESTVPGTDSTRVQHAIATLGSVVIGVRPEHIRVGGAPRQTGRVTDIEYVGGASMVTCSVQGGSLVLRLPSEIRVPGIGDQIPLTWDDECEHLFHPVNRVRIS